jgi:hypothetical protein
MTDFGEDVFHSGRPYEGFRVPVPLIDIGRDGVDELMDAVHRQALELALGEFGEQALDEVEPRGRGSCRG